MTDRSILPHTPDLPELSAYLDDELEARERQRVATHLAVCPVCAARFAELKSLSANFKAMPQESLDFDLAAVIEGRLTASPRPSTARHKRNWFRQWPIAIGAAASIAAGGFMGSMLAAGGAADTPRIAALRVFDTMPPGSLCVGLESCYVKGSVK